MIHHNITEILLKLALNSNQSIIFCDNVWDFWVKGFLLCADIYIAARDPILIRGGVILTSITLPHICACPMLASGLLCIQWYEGSGSCSSEWLLFNVKQVLIYPRSTGRGRVYCFTSVRLSVCLSVCRSVGRSVRPSVRPSVCPKTFFVAFFSATIDGRNLIFGHKLHIR